MARQAWQQECDRILDRAERATALAIRACDRIEKLETEVETLRLRLQSHEVSALFDEAVTS